MTEAIKPASIVAVRTFWGADRPQCFPVTPQSAHILQQEDEDEKSGTCIYFYAFDEDGCEIDWWPGKDD